LLFIRESNKKQKKTIMYLFQRLKKTNLNLDLKFWIFHFLNYKV
jgi:hypothetical protein